MKSFPSAATRAARSWTILLPKTLAMTVVIAPALVSARIPAATVSAFRRDALRNAESRRSSRRRLRWPSIVLTRQPILHSYGSPQIEYLAFTDGSNAALQALAPSYSTKKPLIESPLQAIVRPLHSADRFLKNGTCGVLNHCSQSSPVP